MGTSVSLGSIDGCRKFQWRPISGEMFHVQPDREPFPRQLIKMITTSFVRSEQISESGNIEPS